MRHTHGDGRKKKKKRKTARAGKKLEKLEPQCSASEERKMVPLHVKWKTVRHLLDRLNTELPHDPAFPFRSVYPLKLEADVPTRAGTQISEGHHS